jgi:hypothetical protein
MCQVRGSIYMSLTRMCRLNHQGAQPFDELCDLFRLLPTQLVSRPANNFTQHGKISKHSRDKEILISAIYLRDATLAPCPKRGGAQGSHGKSSREAIGGKWGGDIKVSTDAGQAPRKTQMKIQLSKPIRKIWQREAGTGLPLTRKNGSVRTRQDPPLRRAGSSP